MAIRVNEEPAEPTASHGRGVTAKGETNEKAMQAEAATGAARGLLQIAIRDSLPAESSPGRQRQVEFVKSGVAKIISPREFKTFGGRVEFSNQVILSATADHTRKTQNLLDFPGKTDLM